MKRQFAHALLGLEQAILQIPEGIRHLVHDGRAVAPHLLGEPEELDLALETPLDGAALGLGRARPRPEALRPPCLEIADRASGRLGRVAGGDRPDLWRGPGPRDLL